MIVTPLPARRIHSALYRYARVWITLPNGNPDARSQREAIDLRSHHTGIQLDTTYTKAIKPALVTFGLQSKAYIHTWAMVTNAASKRNRKLRKIPDVPSQPSSIRPNLLSDLSLEDCIRDTSGREAAATAAARSDTDMLQAGPSRDPKKGKGPLTAEQKAEAEREAIASFNAGLNSRIEQFGQNSVPVKAYLWAQRHKIPEADYASSEDSERGRSNTDADAEYAALLQAEETDQNIQQDAQVAADRLAAERLQNTGLSQPPSQLIADRRYAEALQRGPATQTRAATRQAAAAQSSSGRTKDTDSGRVQAPESNLEAKLRATISELQANLDHERSKKRTAKVIEPQFPTLAQADTHADELYSDFVDDFPQQAGIPNAQQSRKMGSSQAGPSRMNRQAPAVPQT